jgi:hypothetical protein
MWACLQRNRQHAGLPVVSGGAAGALPGRGRAAARRSHHRRDRRAAARAASGQRRAATFALTGEPIGRRRNARTATGSAINPKSTLNPNRAAHLCADPGAAAQQAVDRVHGHGGSGIVEHIIPLTPLLPRQAEDRAHRRGQRRAVNVYFLIARGTTDERRWQLLDRSLARVSAVHDGVGGGSGGGGGDAGGIALDAVCEAGGEAHWGAAVGGHPGTGTRPDPGSGPGPAAAAATDEGHAAPRPKPAQQLACGAARSAAAAAAPPGARGAGAAPGPAAPAGAGPRSLPDADLSQPGCAPFAGAVAQAAAEDMGAEGQSGVIDLSGDDAPEASTPGAAEAAAEPGAPGAAAAAGAAAGPVEAAEGDGARALPDAASASDDERAKVGARAPDTRTRPCSRPVCSSCRVGSRCVCRSVGGHSREVRPRACWARVRRAMAAAPRTPPAAQAAALLSALSPRPFSPAAVEATLFAGALSARLCAAARVSHD